jgi:hypothetical protein
VNIRRRHFLRGLGGAAVALPFLDSLRSTRVHAQMEDADARRFVAFFQCNGVRRQTFRPNQPYGPLSAAALAGTALEPLSHHVGSMLVTRGIHTTPKGYDPSLPGDDHQKGMGHMLTASPLAPGTRFATGISVDQAIAKAVNPGGRPSLTLHVGHRSASTHGHISYLGPGQPVSGENNPWLAYQDLMGLGRLDPESEDRLVTRRQSVLDLVRDDLERLEAQDMGRADRERLDMHLSAIRELELEMGAAGVVGCELPDENVAQMQAIDPGTVAHDRSFKAMGRMQMDLLAVALACGYTRVATLQWGSGAGGPIFTWDGMNHAYNHHKLSHGSTSDESGGSAVAGYEAMLTDIDTWYATQLAYLCDRLAAYPEGESTVLDNSCVVWMNELSDGKYHDFKDLPFVIVGSCGGYFQQGQYVKVTPQESPLQDVDSPHNKLLTTVMNAVGVTDEKGEPIESFGHPSHAEPGIFDVLVA